MKQNLLRQIPSFFSMLLFPFFAHALDTGVSYAIFSAEGKPYVEVSLEIAAGSMNYQHLDSSRMQASVEVLILIKQGDKVVNYEKYVLNSPEVQSPESLLDVKRFMVPNGEYTLEVNTKDVHDPANTDQFQTPLNVQISDGLYLSEIVLLRDFRPEDGESPFHKNGFYLEPLPFAFYDRAALTLAFYAEIYHTKADFPNGQYSLRYVIERELGNEKKEQVNTATQRKRASDVDLIIAPMDIGKLPSGNYVLSIEVRSTTNELLTSRSIQFQRSNPFLQVTDAELTEELISHQFVQDMNEEQLRYALRAISPVVLGSESEILRNILLQGSELKSMRAFLFRHFAQQNPNSPELAYSLYMETARAVDEKFNTGFRHGFESDRGRIYMRYGTPDDIVHVEDDPSAPPYEIWIYYNFPKTKQQNVKFLFYSQSLAEDFTLLHSTARGEINNPRWEVELYKRNAPNQIDGDNYHDGTQMQSNVGRNARTYFTDY